MRQSIASLKLLTPLSHTTGAQAYLGCESLPSVAGVFTDCAAPPSPQSDCGSWQTLIKVLTSTYRRRVNIALPAIMPESIMPGFLSVVRFGLWPETLGPKLCRLLAPVPCNAIHRLLLFFGNNQLIVCGRCPELLMIQRCALRSCSSASGRHTPSAVTSNAKTASTGCST